MAAAETPDFSKIWASNSPLGRYPISDADYLIGFSSIGSTPPSRGLFDEWMYRADTKMKWMYDNMFSEDSMAGYLFWRLPNTSYFVGEKLALQNEFPDVYLECTTAGTTSSEKMMTLPEGKKAGDVFTDGTVQWTVRQRATTALLDTSIGEHNSAANAHADFNWVKSLSASSDGLHFQTRNASADTVLNLINTLQATLNQGTVPTGNNGTILELLSGIVHQIKALSGKANWWEAPKDSFESLSAGIVAGDVSDSNAWWVKFGGVIPIIIQGGLFVEEDTSTVTLPIKAPNGILMVLMRHGSNIGDYGFDTCVNDGDSLTTILCRTRLSDGRGTSFSGGFVVFCY